MPVLFLLVGSLTDVKARKIKNYITYPMFIIGFLYAYSAGAFLNSIYAIIAVTVIVIVVPGFRVGGGDIKLTAACGAWLGLETALLFILLAITITMITGLVIFVYNNGLKATVGQIKLELITLGRMESEQARLPMAPFILIAYILSVIII